MIGRILALLGGGAMAAVALLLHDPAIYGPDAPQISLGAYETFRALMVFCTAGLALCGLLAAFQPRGRSASRKAPAANPPPGVEADEPPPMAETQFEADPDAFRIKPSPAASPLW